MNHKPFDEMCDQEDRPLGDIFSDHPLVTTVIEDVGRLAGERPAALATDDYQVRVAQRLFALRRGFAMIDQVHVYLRLNPAPKTLRKNGIDRNSWVDYHVAVFLTVIVAVRDAARLLVADCFDMGIDSRDVTALLLRRHLWLEGSAVTDLLNSLYGEANKEAPLRNDHVHELDGDWLVRLLGEQYLMLGPLEFLQSLPPDIGSPQVESLRDYIAWMRESADRELQQHVRSRSVAVLRLLGKLMSELHQEYQRRRRA